MRQTKFPRLDTLAANRRVDETTLPEYGQRDFSFANNVAAIPKGKNDILQAYSSFVGAFTGESEVIFQFSLRTDLQALPIREVVRAATPLYNADEVLQKSEGYTMERFHQSEDEEVLDFGLELLIDPEMFDSTNVPVSLECVSETVGKDQQRSTNMV